MIMSHLKIPQVSYSMAIKDEGRLIYTTVAGVFMAVIFATRLHDEVEITLTNLAPEGKIPRWIVSALFGYFFTNRLSVTSGYERIVGIQLLAPRPQLPRQTDRLYFKH